MVFCYRMGGQGKIDELDINATVSDGSVLLAGREAPVLMPTANLQAQLTNSRTLSGGVTADFQPSGKISILANSTIK